jgi:hypothetical protein
MPLYRIHYQRHGRDHDMTFAALDDRAADAYAHSVLADLVEAPIERVELVSGRPYRKQRTFWEPPT